MSGTWQHGGLAAGALREERAANADLLHRRRRWSAPPEKFCYWSVSTQLPRSRSWYLNGNLEQNRLLLRNGL